MDRITCKGSNYFWGKHLGDNGFNVGYKLDLFCWTRVKIREHFCSHFEGIEFFHTV